MKPLVAQLVDLHKEYQLGPGIEPVGRSVASRAKSPRRVPAIMGTRQREEHAPELLGVDRPTSGEAIARPRRRKMDDDELSGIRNTRSGSFSVFQPDLPIGLENIEVPLHYRPGAPPSAAPDHKHCHELAPASASKIGSITGVPVVWRTAATRRDRPRLVNDPAIIMADEPTTATSTARPARKLHVSSAQRRGPTIITSRTSRASPSGRSVKSTCETALAGRACSG
jgi:hypothetical protein